MNKSKKVTAEALRKKKYKPGLGETLHDKQRREIKEQDAKVFEKDFKGRDKTRIIGKLIEECHEIAVSKGWWTEDRNDGELIALMHSELSEALEALREGNKENLSEELADCCIRIFDYCGKRKIDLESAILKKMEKNRNRPHRHGGKRF